MRERLDKLLVARGLAESRQRAQALIMAGQVVVGERVVDKPGQPVASDAPLRIKGGELPWVSRGGLKLVAALDHWAIDPNGWVCLDVGASTGGFTDVLLERGAARVYAVDVGYGQLAWKLARDPRVVNLERTNIRALTRERIPEPVELLVMDVSFISLRLALPPALPFLKPGGRGVVLIKPQFEVGKGEVGKGGVVRDPEQRQAVIRGIREFAVTGLGLLDQGVIPSPIHGPKGNEEFLFHFHTPACSPERPAPPPPPPP